MNRAMNEPGAEKPYPAVFHFSVVADAPFANLAALREALAGHDVTAPLQAGPLSKGGRYETFRFSARMASSAEHEQFSAALKKINGVKMVL